MGPAPVALGPWSPRCCEVLGPGVTHLGMFAEPQERIVRELALAVLDDLFEKARLAVTGTEGVLVDPCGADRRRPRHFRLVAPLNNQPPRSVAVVARPPACKTLGLAGNLMEPQCVLILIHVTNERASQARDLSQVLEQPNGAIPLLGVSSTGRRCLTAEDHGVGRRSRRRCGSRLGHSQPFGQLMHRLARQEPDVGRKSQGSAVLLSATRWDRRFPPQRESDRLSTAFDWHGLGASPGQGWDGWAGQGGPGSCPPVGPNSRAGR